jgi:DNA-directed RNA polymerase specialized sigma24 family protein
MTLELTASVRLSEIPDTRFLVNSLSHAQSAHFLRLDVEGFVLLCRVSSEESDQFLKAIRLAVPHRIQANVISVEKTGVQVIQVKGHWSYGRGRRRRDGQPSRRFVGLMEKAMFHDMSRLRVSGETLVASVVGEDGDVEKLVAELRHFGNALKIVRLGRPRALVGTALEELTPRQRSVIQLAHAMGYYDIPRRAKTEDIARIFQMEKGTIGDHLRRAEKHLIDSVLLSI